MKNPNFSLTWRQLAAMSGLNQFEFWSRFGVTQSGESRYESGRNIPKPIKALMWLYDAGSPNEPTAMRGGPIFEFLFRFDTQLRRMGRREKIELAFFNPMPNSGNRLGEKSGTAFDGRNETA